MSHRLPEPVSPLPLQAEEDRTPYGQCAEFGPRVFLATCGWIMTAGLQRLTHVALLHKSATSRRFVFWIVAWLALSAAALQFGHAGWRTAPGFSGGHGAAGARPAGRGWYHLAGDESNLGARLRTQAAPVWWNPTVGVIAAAGAFVLMIVGTCSVLAWQQRAARRALVPPYQDQGRLSAALHYGTAWLLLLPPAAVIAALVPLSDIGAAARWPLVVPRAAFYGTAAILAVVGVCGYGFGLIRAGATVPAATRMRVLMLLGVWNPLVIGLVAAGIGLGLHYGTAFLSTRMGLAW